MTTPQHLMAVCASTPEAARWLGQLPQAIAELERRWSLSPGPALECEEASCAWIAPVRLGDETSAVLKLAMPHMEGKHEIEGLQFWNGDPTAQILEADSDLGAMLLERCEPGSSLRVLPEIEQDSVIAQILQRVWRVPKQPHPFRPLSAMLAFWGQETLAQADNWPDAALVYDGLQLFRELPESAPSAVLLATDLHAGNVLRARRKPWLMIDPKPFIGDPAYDATQHLFNCEARLRSQPEETMRRFADLLDVEPERIRLWMFARAAAEPRCDWNNSRRQELARLLAP